jgi:hypothetical protein
VAAPLTASAAVLLPSLPAGASDRVVPAARPSQNWVLTPFQDVLLIIAAPLLCLALALLALRQYGAERGAALVITAHIVLTVAHHLPTFIRIYGDVELFRRFKWNFLLGPLVPLAFATGMLIYLNARDYPVEYILYLYIFLALWDPWHFLRQHFGFTRIYDRNNAAPVRLASNMDWWLCALWFVHIMVASAAWLPGLLEDLQRNAGLPLLLWISPRLLEAAQQVTAALTTVMTLVYAAYLVVCRLRGWYVSPAKLALLVCTFGVMYLTYTPNELILQLAPAWGFKLGFATIGIVHMTQYLAIVWRYDRRLAQGGRARAGWFAWLHSRRTRWGVLLAALGYALFCVAYGDAITTSHDNRLLMSVLLAVGFTSTLMHYYFDGFIWKVRHQQNRQALGLQDPSGGSDPVAAGQSWWTTAGATTAPRMLLRQLLYFGVPLGLLTVGALGVWGADRTPYPRYMMDAQRFSEQGRATDAADAARRAYARMRAELPVARQMALLLPSAARDAEHAFLVYNTALYEYGVMPSLEGRRPTQSELMLHAARVEEAAHVLAGALQRDGPLAHAGHETLTREQAEAVLASWRRQLR